MGVLEAEGGTAQRSALSGARDERISRFLLEVQAETSVAPVLQAGVAFRRRGTWEFSWGSTMADGGPLFFDLASITKAHFAVSVAELVHQGSFSFSTPLHELLPEVRGTHGGSQTIEALLSHRSGLKAHLELFRPSFHGAPVRLDELIARAAGAKADGVGSAPYAPIYSDLGYILVGFAVERLLGQQLDHTLKGTLLDPWGLKSGSVRSLRKRHPDFNERVAPTEIQPKRGGLLKGQVHDDNAWALRGAGLCGHAGLFGRVDDVLGFGVHLLDGLAGRTQGVDPGSLFPLVQKRPQGTLRMGFDGILGKSSSAGQDAGPETFGHLGFTGTSLWCDPERDRVTVLLSNRVYPHRDNPKIRLVRPKIHDFLWTC